MSPPHIPLVLNLAFLVPCRFKKAQETETIIPLIFILRCFVGLFFPLYRLSTYLYETIEDMEQDKSTLAG